MNYEGWYLISPIIDHEMGMRCQAGSGAPRKTPARLAVVSPLREKLDG